MNDLPYLLTASLYLLLFYGCYELLLRRNTFFGLNRTYLLVSIALSLLLPWVDLPGGSTNALAVGTITLPTLVVGTISPAQSDGLSVVQWLWLLYGTGVIVGLIRLGIHLMSVFTLIRQGTAERKPAYTLIRLATNSGPSFSFGRYLVLNLTDSLSQPAALIHHEEAHIRQRHTADVLFIEVVQAVFWFNPVLRLYKHALQEVHEFLADRAAIQHLSTIEPVHTGRASTQPTYTQQLVAYALDMPATALTTPFVSQSTLKQRIVMLQKPQTHRRALLGYALALPLAALLTMCTQSEQDQTATITAQASARKAVKVDGEVFTVVEQQPEFQGGMARLGDYFSKNIKYPTAAQKAKAEGRVFVSFIVTKTGEITNAEILKGIGYGADEEALRVVQGMPRWKPAMHNGQIVNVKYNLPINFQLNDKDATLTVKGPINPFKGIETFLIDGKAVTAKEFTATLSEKIKRMDVDKTNKTVSITTK